MFFCKKKSIKINRGKAYAVCLFRNCPHLITVGRKRNKLISKLKLHAKEKNNRLSKKTQAYENKGKQTIQRNDNCNERN